MTITTTMPPVRFSVPTSPTSVPLAAPPVVGAGDPFRHAWVERVMGMPVSLHLRGRHVRGPLVEHAVALAFARMREMDRIFSMWLDTSDVMRLRRGEVTPRACDPLLLESVALGELAARLTRGAFTTLLPDGDGRFAFDPTGLVKGWAVDLASSSLLDLPDTALCINAGGDLLIGAHPSVPDDGPEAIEWRVGIEDPRDRTTVAHTLVLTRGAVATSGTAARGAHLWDPRTRERVGRAGSVTVTGPTLLWADIWATALFVGDADIRDAFARYAPDHTAIDL